MSADEKVGQRRSVEDALRNPNRLQRLLTGPPLTGERIQSE